MKKLDSTQSTDKGREGRSSREGSHPPLRTDQITDMAQSRRGSQEPPKTALEYVAGMAEREMTPKPGSSKQDDSSNSSDSEAWREHRRDVAKGKRAAGTPEGEPETKVTKFDRSKTPESQYKWPEYNPAAYVSDTNNRAGSDVYDDEDNPFQDEMEMFNDHVESYERYKRDNRKVLDAVLESEKTDRKTIDNTIKNIRNSDTDIDILRVTNQQLDRIVNTVEIAISD